MYFVNIFHSYICPMEIKVTQKPGRILLPCMQNASASMHSMKINAYTHTLQPASPSKMHLFCHSCTFIKHRLRIHQCTWLYPMTTQHFMHSTSEGSKQSYSQTVYCCFSQANILVAFLFLVFAGFNSLNSCEAQLSSPFSKLLAVFMCWLK